ncbi:hypothetical protein J2Z83_000056 [Virgibacillus natechei]|uniref:Uncharacterized protein n=1 Tax=Virgibacillus natechei TaxID=1216297 RepID=A0ABS4IAK9_9BACI|nr:hypothetical protein [Virgibacillus natechei]MBP1967964.1 hypothetical protein [Virgibacillus natechei]UZD14748.1 hypothetical protein OLD84_09710 [Virgibacillus natechei]
MRIEINSVNVSYNDKNIESVRVNFNGRNDDRSINVNGNLRLSEDEYKGNESLDILEEMVRDYVVTELTEDNGDNTAE